MDSDSKMVAFWGGVACCLIAVVLFSKGWSNEFEAKALKSVTRVNHLMDLDQLFGYSSKVLPYIVTISGRVGSDTPISCQYSDLSGVIVKETAEQHYLKRSKSGTVSRDFEVIHSTRKEVPWYLDDGTGRAFVVGARDAEGFSLTLGGEVFEEANSSGECSRGGGYSDGGGLLGLGVKRVERVLRVGTRLTVVGEVVKDDTGTIQVRQPKTGPFYVSNKSIDELIEKLRGDAGWQKFASVVLIFIGVFLLLQYFTM